MASRTGQDNREGRSARSSLEWRSVSTLFRYRCHLRLAFYQDIRCGLLHQAEAKNKWLIRRKQKALLRQGGRDGYIIDVERFHTALKRQPELFRAGSAGRKARTYETSSGPR